MNPLPHTAEPTIRAYRREDIDVITAAILEYVPQLPNYHGVALKEDRIRFVLEQNVNNDGFIGVMLLVDAAGQILGGVGMYCVTMLVSDAKMTNDIFLFMFPKHRSLFNFVRLANAYRDWAKARGAAVIQLSHVGGHVPEDKADKLCELSGFKRVGSIYWLKRESV